MANRIGTRLGKGGGGRDRSLKGELGNDGRAIQIRVDTSSVERWQQTNFTGRGRRVGHEWKNMKQGEL